MSDCLLKNFHQTYQVKINKNTLKLMTKLDFSQTFLGEYDTPEAIWNNEMRQFMIQKIAYHLSDFTPRLKSNVKALYQVCPLTQFNSDFFL